MGNSFPISFSGQFFPAKKPFKKISMLIKLLVLIAMMVSIAFAVVVQMRLFNYAKKHPFPESKYTWLFRFIKLSYVNAFYLLSVGLHTALFIWLTFYYL